MNVCVQCSSGENNRPVNQQQQQIGKYNHIKSQSLQLARETVIGEEMAYVLRENVANCYLTID